MTTTQVLIAPTDLRDYLKGKGWLVRPEALDDRLYVLENSQFERRQLIFPVDATAPDYRDSVAIVLEKVASLLQTAPAAIAASIVTMRDDVIRLRIFDAYRSNDLPLGFASSLVANAEKLLKAAACTVVRPRLSHPRLALNEANQFIQKSRFGQTEEGSFVIKVACPLDAVEEQGRLELGEENTPFTRQVTISLHRGLSALSRSIEADSLDDFVDRLKRDPNPLVSSNLCDALTAMHDEDINNSLDLAFDWSVLRSAPASENRNLVVRFQRDYFPRVEEVQRELKSLEHTAAETFVGTVERLEGDIGPDGRRSGPVVLALLPADESETVRARLDLDPDSYARAAEAHMKTGAFVVVAGRLRPGRQPRQLVDVSSFTILPPQQLTIGRDG